MLRICNLNCALCFQAYISFYVNIEGWKVSAEHQLHALEVHSFEGDCADVLEASTAQRAALLENIREAAHSIYEEYLSEKANPRLRLDDESAVKRLLFRVRTEPPDSEWFSEVQEAVFRRLQSDERFLESFKKSMGYVKLLAEFDLLKEPSARSEEDEEFSIYDSLNSLEDSRSSLDELEVTLKPEEDCESASTVKTHRRCDMLMSASLSPSARLPSLSRMGSGSLRPAPTSFQRHRRNASQGSLTSFESLQPILAADVVDCKTVREAGQSYAVYKVLVRSRDAMGQNDERHTVYRRYPFVSLEYFLKKSYVSRACPFNTGTRTSTHFRTAYLLATPRFQKYLSPARRPSAILVPKSYKRG